ncbi:MAG: pyridoxamine 5'-phosphate oxidase family protein [Acidimicrobiaceae bacterium]|nr:pyridoxamine 5'-phosphate oxidase family protein [Acidimicrobiaceae bacterium]MYA74788.1 pyridoxamine 5'-phosphate oxidase family protein [Acidimicrobiaceae bacterium]MYG54588.1 pyridoxamine 5'-phosphate oxidase family protein [Acidimicrobiaceae bacterium]MYJ97695.1 pyridoxamine 5'-phosphate oxidase family protein [Acidimicrobiaceae bacterium]
MAVTNQTELRSVYREPMPRAAQKVVDRLDVHCRKFIALSPFCIVSSTGVNGRADASPRGDHPGFVQVLDDRTLLIPDRPGNNQVDSLQNILVHPVVGLLFLVPGMNETLRVCGTAEIVTDPELLAPLAIRNRVPVSGLRITITDAFLHCGRALLRARLWDPEAQIDRGDYPTYGQVLADQIAGANAQEIDASEDEANREQLY